jgi:hypothetical protein
MIQHAPRVSGYLHQPETVRFLHTADLSAAYRIRSAVVDKGGTGLLCVYAAMVLTRKTDAMIRSHVMKQ